MTINPPLPCAGCINKRVCVNVTKQQTYLVCSKAEHKPCHELKKCPENKDISIRL